MYSFFCPRCFLQILFYISEIMVMAVRPRLSSLTETGSPHAGQKILPSSIKAEKIMSSKVAPSPREYHGPASNMPIGNIVCRRLRRSHETTGTAIAKQFDLHNDLLIRLEFLLTIFFKSNRDATGRKLALTFFEWCTTR